MTRIPPAALLLAIAGLAPFLFGAMMALGMLDASVNSGEISRFSLLSATDGQLVLVRYGVIILCFMSGVLWGFATRAEGTRATLCYIVAVLPTLWIFLNPGRGADEALINLLVGFVGVLILDYAFFRWKLAPEWWMSLRIPVTAVVVICLGIGIWA